MATKKVALYSRVSTDRQTTENQLIELRAVAERDGWVIVDEYIDQGISGAKGRDKRPEFDRLLKDAARKTRPHRQLVSRPPRSQPAGPRGLPVRDPRQEG